MKITINLNLNPKRERNYLTALRQRYQQPTWGWSRLVLRAIREIVALQEEPQPSQLFFEEALNENKNTQLL